MDKKTIALIGDSGAGKSKVLKLLCPQLAGFEMDQRFGTTKVPEMREALDWIARNDLVAVSVHIEMFKRIAEARRDGAHTDLLDRILFVYLRNHCEDERSRYLMGPDAEGKTRDELNLCATTEASVRNHAVFEKVADITVNTTGRSLEYAAEIIRCLRQLTSA